MGRKYNRLIGAIVFVGVFWLGAALGGAGETQAKKAEAPKAGQGVELMESPKQESETAKPPDLVPTKTYKGKKISIDFIDVSVRKAVKLIGSVSGKTVVIPDNLSDGPIAIKLNNVPWDQALDMILEPHGLGAIEVDNQLIIKDLVTLRREEQSSLPKVDRALAKADGMLQKVYTPKYTPVDIMRWEMDKAKSERGKLVAIGNDIYVEDEPGVIAAMDDIFLKNDIITRQILIEARIIEAAPGFLEQLRTDRQSAPQTQAKDGQEVSIKPRAQSFGEQRYNAGSYTEFKDTHMELKVKPHIEENGSEVTLDITLIKNSVGENYGGEPAIEKREAKIKVKIKNGETVVIDGIKSDETSNGEAAGRRTPLFRWLYPNRSPDAHSDDLLIFITANIIPLSL